MRRAVRLLAVAAAVVALGTACSAQPGDVRAGDCFSKGTVSAFAWGSQVRCDSAHTVEVFATFDVTGPLGRYPRSALSNPTSPATDTYHGMVRGLCEPAWSRYTGYRDLTAKRAPGATPLPALYGDMAIEALPAPAWDAGNKSVACYQVFGRLDQPDDRAISVSTAVLPKLRSAPDQVPLEVRDCATDGDADRKVSCTASHDREYLGNLNLAQFVGNTPGLDQAFLDRFDSTTAPPAAWGVLDALCQQVFSPLVGSDRGDIHLLSQVYSHDPKWGWADHSAYHAACFAQTDQQTTGSVVGLGSKPLQPAG